MKHIPFFFRQALANMNRNRQRTLFVFFCVAVGVAAVVSLRTLGLMIGATLTGNLQATNRGDMVITPVNPVEALGTGAEIDRTLIDQRGTFGAQPTFSEIGLNEIQAWADENDFDLLLAVRQQTLGQLRPVDGDAVASFSNLYLVQPEGYPFYADLEFVAPDGITLEKALAGRDGLVVTERLADELDLDVGDEVTISGSQVFRVNAIMADSAEASLSDLNTVLVPYAYISYDLGTKMFGTRADTIYVRTPEGTDVVAATQAFQERFQGLNVINTEDVKELNTGLSEGITRLITTMGLVSLLIGGIGIVNTMIVVVGRRTVEIGVLKTIGLQGRQITLMFIIESLLVGALGSLLGAALGLGLVFILQRVAEEVFAQSLSFAIYPEAIVMGVVLGTLVTLVFGFLPTLSAGRVRPNVVLAPTDAVLPSAGRLVSVVVILLLTAPMGLLVGQVMGNYLLGLGLAYLAVITLAGAVLFFWVLVIVFSRLPSFGSVYLKLAQRAVGTQAGRTASTLLALVVGVFALSVILLMTRSVLNLVNDLFEDQVGGNVIVGAESLAATDDIDAYLVEQPQIGVTRDVIYTAEIVAINGDRDMEALTAAAVETGEAAMAEAGMPFGASSDGGGGLFGDFDLVQFQLNFFLASTTLQRAGDLDEIVEVSEGEPVTTATTGGVSLVESPATQWLGLGVGDTLTFRFKDGQESDVTVVGLVGLPESSGANVQVNAGPAAQIVVSDDAIPAGVDSEPPSYILDVPEAEVDAVIADLAEISGVFAIDISQVNELLGRLLNQFAALPLIVAVLALFASGVIIANTVSLATLERRREIGIMKAIGLQTRSVLILLLLEHGLVGLLGGLIGTGMGAAIIFVTGIVSSNLGSFPLGTLILLVLLSVVIAVAATLITALGAAREKPLHVLRYE